MREETRRGYLYVPANPENAVAVYAVEHMSIAVPGVQAARVRKRPPGDPVTLRARAVAAAAEGAEPGLYRLRVLLRPQAGLAGRWTVVRGVRVRSLLDEIGKLEATARRRPDGQRPNVRALRAARRARALADALRRYVLPVLHHHAAPVAEVA